MEMIEDISLTDFDFWGGARTNADMLTQDELETLEGILESEYAMKEHTPTKTEINDLMWFEFETICQWLGIEYDHRTGDVIREALHSGKALTGIKLHESFKRALANRGVALKESKVTQGKKKVVESKGTKKKLLKEGVEGNQYVSAEEATDHVVNNNGKITVLAKGNYIGCDFYKKDDTIYAYNYQLGPCNHDSSFDLLGHLKNLENDGFKFIKSDNIKDTKRLHIGGGPVDEGCKKKATRKAKKLTESVREEDRIKALAYHLEVEPETITVQDTLGNLFETEDGEVYFVGDYEESYEAARQDIENVFDDLGLESFTPDFRDWIFGNAVESDWFEDAWEEMEENYVDSIENESDDVYENRLISELVDEGILTEDDFDNWGEDEPVLKDTVDLDEKKREYVESLIPNDPVQAYLDEFGDRDFSQAVRENNLIDMDAVVDECISEDGIAHFVARYDGDELDLGNGLYAYRVD